MLQRTDMPEGMSVFAGKADVLRLTEAWPLLTLSADIRPTCAHRSSMCRRRSSQAARIVADTSAASSIGCRRSDSVHGK
jgi:hypothetical protein